MPDGPRKKLLVLLAALALFLATPALAATGDTWIGLQFGGSVPRGHFTKSANGGIEGGLVGTYFGNEHVGAGVDAAYHMWSDSDYTTAQLVALLGPGWRAELMAIQTTAHVLYDFGTVGPARPYAKVGCGIYWVNGRLYTPNGSSLGDWHPYFGYNLGAGVNLPVGPVFDIGVCGAYHNIQIAGPDENLYTVGLSLLWRRGAK